MTRGSVPFYYENSPDHSLYNQGRYLDRTIYAFPIVSSNARSGFPSSPALTSPIKVNSPMNNGVVVEGRIGRGGYTTPPFNRPPLVSDNTGAECVRQSNAIHDKLAGLPTRLFSEPRNESSPRAVAFSQKPLPRLHYIRLGAFRNTPLPLPHIPLNTPRDERKKAINLHPYSKVYSEVPQNLALYSGASFSSPLPVSSSTVRLGVDLLEQSLQLSPQAIQSEGQNRQLQPSEEVKITLEEVEKALVFSKNYKPLFYKEVKLEIKKHETIIEKINSFYNKLFNKPDYAKTVEDNKTKALVREYKIADIATKADGSKVREYIEKLRNPQEDIKKFRHTGEPETNNLYNELNKLEPNFLTKGSFFSPKHNLREKIANALELGLEIKQKNNLELNHLIKAIGMDYYADPKVGQIAKLARMINYNDDALTALSEKGIKKQIIDFASLIILPVVHSPKLINPPLGDYHVDGLPERHYEDGPSPSAHSRQAKNLFETSCNQTVAVSRQ